MRNLDHGGSVLELAAARGVDWRTFVDFSASINPLGPPAEVLELLGQHPELVTCYPSNDHASLRSALADYCRVTPDHILAGNGATDLVHFTLRFLRPQQALVALPTFSEFPRACVASGVRTEGHTLIRADNGDWCIDWTGLEEALSARHQDLLILVHPNNPTGATLGPSHADRLMELTQQRGTAVLLDESFIDFAPDESWIDELGRYGHLLVLRSLTKFFAIPGLRLGYLVARPELVARMQAAREPWQVNQFAQMAGVRCVRPSDYHEATRRLIREERAWLTTQLARLPALSPYPSRVNILLVRIDPERIKVGTVYDRLLAQGVIVRNCDGWPGLPENCLRIAVRSRKENQRLVDALKECLCAAS
jgi:threonine-phosphate decarboxylase